MRGTEEIEHIAPLVRVARVRRRLGRQLAHIALLVGLGAIGGLVATRTVLDRGPDCRAAARHTAGPRVVAVCEREYLQTSDPAIGVLLADAYRSVGNTAAATAIANGLLATRMRDDALRILTELRAAR